MSTGTGSAVGSAVGTGLGAVIGGIPTLGIGAPLGAMIGGSLGTAVGAGVGSLADPNRKTSKDYQKYIEQQFALMKSNPMALGMSDAELRQKMAEAQQQNDARGVQQATLTNQAALAGQGFQQGGMAEAARQAADVSGETAAGAGKLVQELNNQMILQRMAQIDNAISGRIAFNQQLDQIGFDRTMGAITGMGITASKIGALEGGKTTDLTDPDEEYDLESLFGEQDMYGEYASQFGGTG